MFRNFEFNFLLDKETDLNQLLTKVDRNIDLYVGISLKFVIPGFIIAFFILGLANVVYCLITFGFVNVEHLFLPYKF